MVVASAIEKDARVVCFETAALAMRTLNCLRAAFVDQTVDILIQRAGVRAPPAAINDEGSRDARQRNSRDGQRYRRV